MDGCYGPLISAPILVFGPEALQESEFFRLCLHPDLVSARAMFADLGQNNTNTFVTHFSVLFM